MEYKKEKYLEMGVLIMAFIMTITMSLMDKASTDEFHMEMHWKWLMMEACIHQMMTNSSWA